MPAFKITPSIGLPRRARSTPSRAATLQQRQANDPSLLTDQRRYPSGRRQLAKLCKCCFASATFAKRWTNVTRNKSNSTPFHRSFGFGQRTAMSVNERCEKKSWIEKKKKRQKASKTSVVCQIFCHHIAKATKSGASDQKRLSTEPIKMKSCCFVGETNLSSACASAKTSSQVVKRLWPFRPWLTYSLAK